MKLMHNISYEYLLIFLFAILQTHIASAQDDTYGDNFGTVAYNNNDGNQNWATNWVEIDDNSVNSGRIQINGGRLRFEDITRNSQQIIRSADLSGVTSAILLFDWQTTGLDGSGGLTSSELLSVQVSSDGVNFTTLVNLGGTQTDTFVADISAFISSTTTIRFTNLSTWGFGDWEANEFVFIDNLFIQTNAFLISNGGTVNTCGGTFYDSGGPNGQYNNNENFTYTICPDVAGSFVSADFTAFSVEDEGGSVFDFLSIYDGNNTTTLIGSFYNTDNSNAPGVVTSTDASGCLTFVFSSDVSVTEDGWSATISCSTPTPTLSITDVSVDENAGNMTFTVTHIGLDTSGSFMVDYTTNDNTATAGVGNDYIAQTGTLNFSGTSGDDETITITILDDISIEGDETFFIDFLIVDDPSVDITDQGVGTIIDIEIENPRPYEERITRNVRGNFDMIGNTNLTCAAGCPGTPTSNNGVTMGYTSIDGTTINSSSSDLTLPAGATVSWAGLYWGGSYFSNIAGITNPSAALNIQQVELRDPVSGTYTTINASITNVENQVALPSTWSVFMSYADITTLVQGAGSGTYTVADIPLITGSGFTGPFGGWTMVIIYEDPADITRSVSVWDGFDFFGFGANDSFTVTGLLTPSSGAFDTDAGYFGMDGDSGAFTGDFVAINGTALFNGLNPANNTLNSTISKFGVDVGGRNPNQSFNWGIDIDVFDATGLVPNNATTLNVDLGSASEGIWGGVFVVSTEVAFPAVASKNFSPTTINYGEESTVTIVLENPGTGVDLTNLSLTDNLPSGMRISTSPDATTSCGGTITAVTGTDNFSISGVNLLAGNSCTFTFDVIGTQVGSLDNTVSSGDITNDQNIPLAGTTTGTLNVIIGNVITNRRITYRIKSN